MKIKSKRRRVEVVTYHRTFDRGDGSGASFDCDAEGVVDVAGLWPAGRANFEQCLTGADEDGRPLKDRGAVAYRNSYIEPAIGVCDRCGRPDVVLSDALANTCAGCGADYNLSGQRLAPRSQWGEETGESLADMDQPNTEEGAIDAAFLHWSHDEEM